MSVTFNKGDVVRLLLASDAGRTRLDPVQIYTVGAVVNLSLTQQHNVGHHQWVFLDGVLSPFTKENGYTDTDPEQKGRTAFSGAYFEKVKSRAGADIHPAK